MSINADEYVMIESPCIKVCKLDPASGLCTGCLRTIDEIRAWREASLEQKQAIVDAVRLRQVAALAA